MCSCDCGVVCEWMDDECGQLVGALAPPPPNPLWLSLPLSGHPVLSAGDTRRIQQETGTEAIRTAHTKELALDKFPPLSHFSVVNKLAPN